MLMGVNIYGCGCLWVCCDVTFFDSMSIEQWFHAIFCSSVHEELARMQNQQCLNSLSLSCDF